MSLVICMLYDCYCVLFVICFSCCYYWYCYSYCVYRCVIIPSMFFLNDYYTYLLLVYFLLLCLLLLYLLLLYLLFYLSLYLLKGLRPLSPTPGLGAWNVRTKV